MKSSLRQGGAADLNLYSVGFTSGDSAGLLGYSTFPWDYESNPSDDGVVFLFSSVPNGGTTNYEEGRVRILFTYPTSPMISLTDPFLCWVDCDARSRTLGWSLPHLPGRMLRLWRQRQRYAR